MKRSLEFLSLGKYEQGLFHRGRLQHSYWPSGLMNARSFRVDAVTPPAPDQPTTAPPAATTPEPVTPAPITTPGPDAPQAPAPTPQPPAAPGAPQAPAPG